MMKNFTPSTPLQANTPQTQNTPKLPLNTNTKPEPKAQPQTAGAKIDEKLEKMPWFHGLLTRENAEKLLTRDGDYLVRETNKAEKQYVLSGRYKGECRHIFLVDPSGVVKLHLLILQINQTLQKNTKYRFKNFRSERKIECSTTYAIWSSTIRTIKYLSYRKKTSFYSNIPSSNDHSFLFEN